MPTLGVVAVGKEMERTEKFFGGDTGAEYASGAHKHIHIGDQGRDHQVNTLQTGGGGVPTLGVVAVGKEMERTEKFFLLATRVLAENGANIVKSYYCEGFERVAAACPVPIVGAVGLEDIPAHIHSMSSLPDGLVSHLQGLRLGQLLPSGAYLPPQVREHRYAGL